MRILFYTFIAISLFLNPLKGQNTTLGGFSFSLNFSPNDTICFGATIFFGAGGSSGISWSWGSSQGVNYSPAVNSPTVNATFPTPGTYTIYLMASKWSETAMKSIQIVVLPRPNVSLNISPKTICTTQLNVQWNGGLPLGGSYIGPRVNMGDSVLQEGTYIYTYSFNDANGCQASASDSISVNACVGINELENENVFNIFPNPAVYEITITSNEATNKPLKINDALGRTVKEFVISDKQQTVSISDLESGMYYVSIEGKAKQKLLKQ